MLQTNSQVELLIEKPVAGGRMLARHDGQIVLVTGTMPGERVRARIERTARGVAFAETRAILEPAAARREPSLDPACGGNVYAHVQYDAQLEIKRAVLRDALAHGGRIEWTRDLPVMASPEQGYRMRARLHVRHGRVGFFREGSHALCDAASTGQLTPKTIAAVLGFIDVTPRPWLDAIDAIELTENVPGDQRAMHLHWSAHADVPADLPREWNLARLPGLTGLSGVLRASGRLGTITGAPFVTDRVSSLIADGGDATPAASGAAASDAQLQRHASSFFQANRFLLSRLVSTVLRRIDDGPVVDCYAGVGLFAIALAASGRTDITAIEGDPSSARDLLVNAQPFASQLTVEHESVERCLAARAIPEPRLTIIVDPPRTGMSREALDGVLRADAARIVYVSCDVATLARDLRRIIDHGYELTHLEAFDLFPNTAHVESLAVLDRTAS
jgi:23S rRNA (uracil1939-C5)-methyltransferase